MGLLQPQIEGFYTSWAQLSIALSIMGGQDMLTSDFSALDWDHKLEGEKVPGTGPLHVGRTIGIYEAAASMTMWHSKGCEFQKALMDIGAARGLGYMQVPFNVVCSYEPIGQATPLIYTVKIPGCTIATEALKNASGAAPTALEFTLNVGGVIEKVLPDGTRLSPLLVG